ncbi:hemin-degrading factor [Uliginosibacterium sp. H1]|uniref:hemin-degrading factor n=1 Tax=Uliginosibacterium sp. H1 TaxID=3114757 RepID=UPI002E16B8E1|nr:ChuX/HutX family heme-like substrate-binding protein [Uliginosibacterium sp. H1]
MNHPQEASSALRARHDALVAVEPKLRIRDRAARLGVSEAELLAAGCGVQAVSLGTDLQAVFRELGSLGEVMALSRNDWCVHERHGAYTGIEADGGPMGIVLGPDIDLRLFFGAWRYVFAVTENERHSLQFFDKSGTAIHKVYRSADTDGAAWDALVARFASQAPVEVAPEAFAPSQDAAQPQDSAALRAHWLGLQDTHDFFAMLRKFKVTRVGALQSAGRDLAQAVPAGAVESMLQAAAQQALPIMCFVANRGIVQIHTGTVERLVRTGPWFNVLDPKFNLHLDTTAIASCWVVNKPTRDGWVTSLEAFAANGEMIVQFFGERKPGKAELPAWRALLQGLCSEPLAA